MPADQVRDNRDHAAGKKLAGKSAASLGPRNSSSKHFGAARQAPWEFLASYLWNVAMNRFADVANLSSGVVSVSKCDHTGTRTMGRFL